MKKRRKENGIHIHLSNRLAYTLIVIFILVAVGVGIYALTPGVAPNPGHLASEMAPPSPCSANQYLQFDGTNWVCGGETDSNVASWAKPASASIPVTQGTLVGFCVMTYTWNAATYQQMSDPSVSLISSTCSASQSPMTCGSSYCSCPTGYNRVGLNPGIGALGTNSGGHVRTYFTYTCAKL
jgi:hypothetical protein